jgi:hypothetical protein
MDVLFVQKLLRATVLELSTKGWSRRGLVERPEALLRATVATIQDIHLEVHVNFIHQPKYHSKDS